MPKRNLAWILIIISIAVLFWVLPRSEANRQTVYELFEPLVDVYEQVRGQYVEEVDDARLMRGAIEGMLWRLDPFSRYIGPEDYAEFQERTSGALHGIGIELGPQDGQLVIIAPIDDTPAWRAGIMPGDVILKIDKTPTEHMSVSDAAKRIRGEPGTRVVLTLRRGVEGQVVEVTIVRQEIKIPSIKGWRHNKEGGWSYLVDPKDRIGYIRLTSFVSNTAEQLSEALEKLHRADARAIVLDLRFNPGGLLKSAIDVSDRFLDGGLIVSTRGRNRKEDQYSANREGTFEKLPMVVLVNRHTASAAEIVSGALRDHERATVVGERTFGKGSVQEVLTLADKKSAIQLTTAYYYLPKGECIHRSPDRTGEGGVKPDVEIVLDDEEMTEVLEARRAADIYREGTTRPAEEVRQTPLMDKQLARALKLLRETIDKP